MKQRHRAGSKFVFTLLSVLLPFVPLKVRHCRAANSENTWLDISVSCSGAPVLSSTALSPQPHHANEKEQKKKNKIKN